MSTQATASPHHRSCFLRGKNLNYRMILRPPVQGLFSQILKGEAAGHAFHGNQYIGGTGKDDPGFTGVQHFRGQWMDSNGQPLPDSVLQRLSDLKVPPGWKSVQLSLDPKAAMQATGRDDAGRKQYRYSAEHSEAKAAEKFARIGAFNDDLPGIRKTIASDLSTGDPSAAVLAMIDRTGFRIGSESDTGAKVQAYGISTLEAQHVRVNGDSISLEFVGKSGKINSKTIEDPELAAFVSARLNVLKAGDQVFQATDSQVRAYMKTIAPDFSPKDFRTWHGTTQALAAVKSMPVPRTAEEYQKTKARVGDLVAAHLGNTRAVALGSYIDPAVFAPWSASAPARKADNLQDLMDEFLASTSYDQTGDWHDLPDDPQDD